MTEPVGATEGAVIDREHQVQLRLLASLREAVADRTPPAAVGEILQQLLDYSRVHFLSEQLLMRLHAYPSYQAHVTDHDRLLEQLETVRQSLKEGQPAEALAAMESLREDLLAHIETRDHDLGRYLEEVSAPGQAPVGPSGEPP